MSNYVINIDKDYVDVHGRALIGSNTIKSVFNYDSSSEESWQKNYIGVGDLPTLTTSGSIATGWQVNYETTVTGSYTVAPHYGLFNYNNGGDVLRKHGVVSYSVGYGSDVYNGSQFNLLSWPVGHGGIATFGPLSDNNSWVNHDMEAPRRFDSAYIDWCGAPYNSPAWTNDKNYFPKVYTIQVSDDNITYDTVVSGTTSSGQVLPNFHQFEMVEKRYVKVNMQDNWGGTDYCAIGDVTLSNMSEYDNKPAVMFWQNSFLNSSTADYCEILTEVNLSDVDSVYVRIGGYKTGASSKTQLYVNDTKYFDYDEDISDYWDNYYRLDTSSEVGLKNVKIRYIGEPTVGSYRPYNYTWLDFVSLRPSWYDEEFSSTRGGTKYFPNNVAIIADVSGLSIIDISNVDSTTGLFVNPALWMRFEYDTNNFLQAPPSEITAKDGKIYLSTTKGLYIIDFVDDCVYKYTTSGLFKKGPLALRNMYTEGLYDDLSDRGLFSLTWREVDTASSSQLPSNIVGSVDCKDINGSEGNRILCGTDTGAFSLVSGTVYQSAFSLNVDSVSLGDWGAAFTISRDGATRVGLTQDLSFLGQEDFDIDYTMHQDNLPVSESFNQNYDNSKWLVTSNDFISPVVSGTHLTISGTNEYLDARSQHIMVALKEPFADRPFKAEAYVQIKHWPELCPGELRFGVFNGENIPSFGYDKAAQKGVYVSARNTYEPPAHLYSCDFTSGFQSIYNFSCKFWAYSSYPSQSSFQGNTDSYFAPVKGEGIRLCSPVNRLDRFTSGDDFNVSSNLSIRFKLKLHSANGDPTMVKVGIAKETADTDPRSRPGVFFIIAHYNSTYPQFYTPGYSLASSTGFGAESFLGTAVPKFENDCTNYAEWHDVYLIYNGTNKSLDAWIDTIYVGSVSLPSLTDTARFMIIDNGAFNNQANVTFKDFVFDWVDSAPLSSDSKYAVCKKEQSNRIRDYSTEDHTEYPWNNTGNEWYMWDLDGDNTYKIISTKDFFGTEGTPTDGFRKWEIYYDPYFSSLACYIDGDYIGTSEFTSSAHTLGNIGIGFDTQFYPPTTISGSKHLEVNIKDFLITYSGSGEIKPHTIPEDFFPLASGSQNTVVTSSYQESQNVEDINVLSGGASGVSKINVVNVSYSPFYDFKSGGVPAEWSVDNMPGATGSSSWAVAEESLKQSGDMYGHGGSLSDDGLFAGPFGTHMLTDISCDRTAGSDDIIGKSIVCRIRSTASGVVGVGFNEESSVVGTVESGSGYYVTWVDDTIRLGRFEKYYDSAFAQYSPLYTITGTKIKDIDGPETVVDVPRNLVISFVDADLINIYVDGNLQFSVSDTEEWKKTGYLSLISNNNNNAEFLSVGVYDNDAVSLGAVSKVYNSDILYGEYDNVSSVVQEGNLSRSTGLVAVGTNSGPFKWRKLEKTKDVRTWNASNQQGQYSYWLSFIYDRTNNKLIGKKLASASSTASMEVSCISANLEYDLNTNSWYNFSPFSVVPTARNVFESNATWQSRAIGVQSSFSYTNSISYNAGVGGTSKYAYSPADEVVYVLDYAPRAVRFDIADNYSYEVINPAWTSFYTSFDTPKEYMSRYRNNWGWELGFQGSDLPKIGKPAFCWYNGSIVMSKRRSAQYYSFPGWADPSINGDVLWTLLPYSGKWSHWAPGLGSLNGNNYTTPPVNTEWWVSNYDYETTYNQSMVYCEFNDSIYVIRLDMMHRLDIRKNAWYVCSSLPFTMEAYDSVESRASIDMEYITSLNKIFVINSTDNKIHMYDIVTDTWESDGNIPLDTNKHSCMAYAHDIDKVFVSFGYKSISSQGIDTATEQGLETYELSLPPNNKVISYDYQVDRQVLPEESENGRFYWCGPDNFIKDDSFVYADYNHSNWITSSSGYGNGYNMGDGGGGYPVAWANSQIYAYEGNINSLQRGWVGLEPGGYTRIGSYLEDTGGSSSSYRYSQVGGISSRVPIRSNSFTAILDVRYAPTMQMGSSGAFYKLFGVSQGNINNGGLINRGSIPARMHSRGLNGIYMCAVDHTSYPKRYSLVKRDGPSWDESNFTSNYNDSFAGGDGDWDSPYREWSISYNAESQRLDAYIEGQHIGYDILNSEMPEMYLEIGYAHPTKGSSNGYMETDIKNFSIDFNGGNETHRIEEISQRLEIDKREAYNSGFYYERTFSDLAPDKNFVYESKVEISRFANSGTPYILSLGRINDGRKDINLCALYSGSSKTIGFWSGGDPWTLASGYINTISHNWSDDSTYRIVKNVDSGYVDLHVNGSDTPSISVNYNLFPDTNPNVSLTSFNTVSKFRRSVSFGVIDIDREMVEVIDPVMDKGDVYDPGVNTLISGTGWLQTSLTDSNTTYNNYDSSLCGWNNSFYYNEPDSGNYDEYVKYSPTTITGCEVSVYCISTYVAADRPIDIPYTIYHSGVVELPTADAYATNNITSVYNGIAHDGTTQSGTATTIDLDGTKYYNGAAYDFSMSLGTANQQLANGATYLGTYTDVSDIYITRDCSTGTYFSAGVIFVHASDRSARLKSTSTSLWSHIKIQADSKEFVNVPGSSDGSGFSIIDTSSDSLLDYYGENSDPAIVDNDITDISK